MSSTLSIGKDLLQITEELIEVGEVKTLNSLHAIIGKMILSGVTANDISLIELNEYIEEAFTGLEKDSSLEAIRNSSIRQLLER